MITKMGYIGRMIFGVILLLLVAVPVARAQDSEKPKAVTIEPFLQEVILEPDDASKTFSVQVTNNTGSTFNFNVEARDFGSLNETGGVFFSGTEGVKLESKYGLADWIELDKSTRSLAAGQTLRIDVTLLNRADLSPGGHYGAIFINSTGNSATTTKPNVNFRQSISALVLAIKRGGERYDLSLDNISSNASWLKKPDKVNLRFRNNGNTHLVPRGLVKLMDGSKVLSSGTINENSSYILPETFRQIPVELKSQNSHPLHLIKTYKLEINYRYDGLDRFAVKTIAVRWINWPLLLTIIGLLAAILFAINYFFGEKIEKTLKSRFKKLKSKK